MDDNLKLLSAMFDKAVEYCKTSYGLVKLKVLEAVTDVISSVLTDIIFYVITLLFVVFLSIGLAYWIGEILGKIYYGFFIIAAFYGVLIIVLHFFMRKTVNKGMGNYVIKKILKKLS